MEKVLELIGIIFWIIIIIAVVLVVMGLFIGLGGLVVWGIGNGIIYLFGLNAVWTYYHGCVSAAIIYGIGWMYRKVLKGE